MPYCSNKKVLVGYNDLETTNPELAAEWHPTKNGNLKPQNVVHGSDKIVWWICDKGHEYQARIANRLHFRNCPICVNKKIVPGVNDLASKYPDLTKQWHPTKNGDLTPDMIAPKSNKKFWWKCELGHEWEATPNKRVSNNRGCPYCCNQKILAGYNDLATTNPKLAAEWHPTKNGDLTPQMISHGSTKRVWWQCSQGHEWESTVNNRDCHKRPCPYCSGRKKL